MDFQVAPVKGRLRRNPGTSLLIVGASTATLKGHQSLPAFVNWDRNVQKRIELRQRLIVSASRIAQTGGGNRGPIDHPCYPAASIRRGRLLHSPTGIQWPGSWESPVRADGHRHHRNRSPPAAPLLNISRDHGIYAGKSPLEERRPAGVSDLEPQQAGNHRVESTR
jgi:hypothetical protein